ncbi:MAG: undecaprenyl/decaprenyl-phosphate alpha-N-acetylglucosaminyl 1-phosphate transferase, partial [bacterium]|nr:undecaprenyl/decaprenyl-phosphate alpha-N-acetylglucosaminyl 1-phosphate transferase [bacterium]
ISDTFLAFFRRIRKKAHPFVADREHIHHQLLNQGLSHRQAVLIINSVSYLWGVIAVVILISQSGYSSLLLLLVAAILIWGIKRLGYARYFVFRR